MVISKGDALIDKNNNGTRNVNIQADEDVNKYDINNRFIINYPIEQAGGSYAEAQTSQDWLFFQRSTTLILEELKSKLMHLFVSAGGCILVRILNASEAITPAATATNGAIAGGVTNCQYN